jgi:DNA repair protein RecN (Recombination protein N)
MLNHLLIKNYALIKQLEIGPSPHLNIITGETGAGKSIMLGAIGMLLGERADTKVLLDSDEKCIVEGTFNLAEYDLEPLFEEAGLDFEQNCTIRREISPAGKSRAFVNDTPVTLDVLRSVGERLMDIHSQHDTLRLGSDDFQLQIVDIFAANQAQLASYRDTYRAFRRAEQHCQRLLKEADDARRELDYQSYLLAELNNAALDGLDQEAMEQELERLDNMETIKASLGLALQYLAGEEQSAEYTLRGALAELRKITAYSPKYEGFFARLDSVFIELRDIGSELADEEGRLFFDEERAQQLKTQLDRVYTLQKKHLKDSLAELVALRDDLAQQVGRALHLDDEIAAAQAAQAQARQAVEAEAARLREGRQAVTGQIEAATNDLLKDLGMPNARLSVDLAAVPPGPSGADAVAFLFSANKGVRPEPLRSVASGGEFSRLMLCIKYILAGKTALPTIVFDEIDTGISGEIAIKVSRMLREMSKRHQLFVISHLPQTAANGDCHYFVYKDNSAERTISRIKKLTKEERISEIAQMIGGANPSATAVKSAKELLAMY